MNQIPSERKCETLSNVEMSPEAREAKRAYQRKRSKTPQAREYMKRWRKENPDKVRAQNVRYWERKAQQARADKERNDNNE